MHRLSVRPPALQVSTGGLRASTVARLQVRALCVGDACGPTLQAMPNGFERDFTGQRVFLSWMTRGARSSYAVT
nr:hypothetical protein [Tanacetum cinerariifolium]